MWPLWTDFNRKGLMAIIYFTVQASTQFSGRTGGAGKRLLLTAQAKFPYLGDFSRQKPLLCIPYPHPPQGKFYFENDCKWKIIFMHLIPLCLSGLLANWALCAAQHPENYNLQTKLQPSPSLSPLNLAKQVHLVGVSGPKWQQKLVPQMKPH